MTLTLRNLRRMRGVLALLIMSAVVAVALWPAGAQAGPLSILLGPSPTPTPTPSPTPSSSPSPTPTATATPTTQPMPTIPTQRFFGFNDDSVTGERLTAVESADTAARVGATSTRLAINWSWIEETPDKYNWNLLDEVYWSNLNRGSRPLFMIMGAPQWAWEPGLTCPDGDECHYPPARAHNDDWQQFMADLAARYPRLAAIEIWNEPNIRWGWGGQRPDPVRYTEVLKLAYGAIKSVNSSMTVLGGAMAGIPDDVNNEEAAGIRPFLQAMYDNGAKGWMDGISVHPYPKSMELHRSAAGLSIAKDIRGKNGDIVPIWATETGFTSGMDAMAENQQGMTIPRLYEMLRGDRELGGIFLHTLVEDPDAYARGFGMQRSDLTPRPAYCALAAANSTSYDCPATVVMPRPTSNRVAHWDAQILLKAAIDAARKVRYAEGSYANVTSSDLHSVDWRVSWIPAQGGDAPGPAADPSRIAVYPPTDGSDGILLCNTSRGDRSFCAWSRSPGWWRMGTSASTIFGAAGATTTGASRTW